MIDPQLRFLYVNPTGECNLSCDHCWVSPGLSRRTFEARDPLETEFSADQFSDLLENAVKLGLSSIKFTGGEPLLRSDFPELYETAAASGGGRIAITLETNGTLVPDGLWEVFQENPPKHVAVSLDSTDPCEHDTFRNEEGAWDRTVDFLEELVQRGIVTQVIQSITETDPDKVIRMAVFCRDKGVSSLKVNPVQPIGRGTSISVSRGDLRSLISFTREVHRICGQLVKVDIPPSLLRINRISSAGLCPILNLLGILPDGGISFCGIGFSCSTLILGNFLKDDLENIWLNSEHLQKLRMEIPNGLEGICGNCIHRNTCRGKCVMQNYYSTGSFTSSYWMCRTADELGLFPQTRKVNPDA